MTTQSDYRCSSVSHGAILSILLILLGFSVSLNTKAAMCLDAKSRDVCYTIRYPNTSLSASRSHITQASSLRSMIPLRPSPRQTSICDFAAVGPRRPQEQL